MYIVSTHPFYGDQNIRTFDIFSQLTLTGTCNVPTEPSRDTDVTTNYNEFLPNASVRFRYNEFIDKYDFDKALVATTPDLSILSLKTYCKST